MKIIPTRDRGRRKKPAWDSRLMLPPIGLLFIALAFLAYQLVMGEIRSSKVLLENRALQLSSDLVESQRSSPETSLEASDPSVLTFALYKQNGKLIAGFGDPPEWIDPQGEGRSYVFDTSRETLTVVRPLVTENGRRGPDPGHPPELKPQAPWPQDPRLQEPHVLEGRKDSKGTVFMTLKVSGYYRRKNLLAVSAIVAPLAILLIGGLFVSLLLKNLRYRTLAEKQEGLAFLGESARTLVHEIRNPLGAIRLQVAVLRRKFPLGEVAEIDAIEEETLRLEVLVRRISDYLKNPGGRPERLDLCAFVRDLSSRYPESLSLDLPEGPVAVRFDPELLRSVLENLLRNALESYPEGEGPKPVGLSLSCKAGLAVVRVTDQGRGIPEELKSKVFDPFYTDKPQGSGIGLPLARRFVEAAGGHLKLESRKGAGTEVWFSIPLAEEE